MDTAILILLSAAVLLLVIIAIKLFSAKKEGSAVTDEKIDNLTYIFEKLSMQQINDFYKTMYDIPDGDYRPSRS